MPSSLSSLFHFENDDHNCKDNDNDNNNKINNNDNYNNYNNNYNEKVRVSLYLAENTAHQLELNSL